MILIIMLSKFLFVSTHSSFRKTVLNSSLRNGSLLPKLLPKRPTAAGRVTDEANAAATRAGGGEEEVSHLTVHLVVSLGLPLSLRALPLLNSSRFRHASARHLTLTVAGSSSAN